MADESDEVILDDEKRTLPVRPIPREEPVSPLPAPPLVPRTRSGELLLQLRAPSDAPPDPVQARLDMWGEAIVATVQEAKAEAATATTHAARASKENLEQDAALGVLAADVATVKLTQDAHGQALATIKAENSLGLKLTQMVVDKVTAKMTPQLGAFVGAVITTVAAALYTWAKGKGWLP